MTNEWTIEKQPADEQIAYWRRAAEHLKAQLKAERRRKAPETLAEIEQELQEARETIAHFRREVDVWKDISRQGWDRLTALESEGAAAVLSRERDQWRAQWRNCTRRLADKIEHLGLDHTGIEPNGDAE